MTMSTPKPFTWIISSEKLDGASAAGPNVHVRGETSGEYLTILQADKSSLDESFLKLPSIKSVLSYVEVPG